MDSLAVIILLGVGLLIALISTVVLPGIVWLSLRRKIKRRKIEVLDKVSVSAPFIDVSYFMSAVNNMTIKGGNSDLRKKLERLDMLEDELGRSTRNGISIRIPDNVDPKIYLRSRFEKLVSRVEKQIDLYEQTVDQEAIVGYLYSADKLAENWERRLQSVLTMLDDGQVAGPKQYMDEFERDIGGMVESARVVEGAVLKMKELREVLKVAEETTRTVPVSRSTMYDLSSRLSTASSNWRMHNNEQAIDLAESVHSEVARRLATLKTQFPTVTSKSLAAKSEYGGD